jgi:hypothetical protein
MPVAGEQRCGDPGVVRRRRARGIGVEEALDFGVVARLDRGEQGGALDHVAPPG